MGFWGFGAAAPETAERVSAIENFMLCLVFCILDVVLCFGAFRFCENLVGGNECKSHRCE